MDVSVCIVNWNTKKLLSECIKSINELTSGVAYEIIVVDNASEDGSAHAIKSEFSDCILIECKKNLGFAKANNIAAKRATGRFVLYLNPDTKLVTNALLGMYSYLKRNDDIGAVGSKLLYPSGSIQFTCARTIPTPLNQFCYLAMLNRLFPKSKFFSTIEMGYWDHLTSREIDCLSGACMMVRKDIIDKLNGFDENLFMYAEDVDLCYRVKQAGWKIYYLATEEIIHYEGCSSSQKKEKNFSAIMQKEANSYFMNKHFGRSKRRQYKLATFTGSIIRLFAIILLIPTLIKKHTDGKNNLSALINKYFNLILWSIGLKKAITANYSSKLNDQ